MTKMHYGKRFGSGVAGGGYGYDQLLDRQFFYPPKKGTVKAVLVGGATSARKRKKPVTLLSLSSDPPPRPVEYNEREKADLHLIETIRLVIKALEAAHDQVNTSRGKSELFGKRLTFLKALGLLKLSLTHGNLKDYAEDASDE